MSPTLQEQIDTLDQTIADLESSPSGVLAYLTKLTLGEYDKSANNTIATYEELADELATEIVDASGSLRILEIGISLL